MKNLFLLFLMLLGCNNYCFGIVRLPAIWGSHMVVKQCSSVTMWGWSKPGKDLEIITSWDNHIYNVKVNKDGKWSLAMHTIEAGGPYSISFDDGDLLVLEDVYLGEVWLCSGQSNMEMPMKGYMGQPVKGSTNVIAEANENVPIRLFSVERNPSKVETEDCVGSWKRNNSEAVSSFSATAYFFGMQLYKTLRIPIGLVHSSWAGSVIQTWLPEKSLKNFPDISLKHLNTDVSVKDPNLVASMSYNGMIHPIEKFKYSGVIWYQGESNRDNPGLYEELFKTLISEWRHLFNESDLPFYYAQIAPFAYEGSDSTSGAIIREVQYNIEKQLPNVGMAVLMDIGEEHCIHPSNKKEVGSRLAYLALKNTYGKVGIPAMSPRQSSKEIHNGSIILSFDNAPTGLTSFGNRLSGFEIAGSDGIFYPAVAKIINRKKVKVWSDKVSKPKDVRYGFKNFVLCNLYGTNGLPVSSFRTDSLDLNTSK